MLFSRYGSLQRRGFTLVELLVVTGILAVLIAILFPLLGHAKERGQISVCSTHLRQIGTAFTLYLGDWEDTFPPFDHAILPNGLLNPYLADPQRQVWICPSDSDINYDQANPLRSSYWASEQFFNGAYYGAQYANCDPSKDPARVFTSVSNPTETIAMAENTTYWWFPSDFHPWTPDQPGLPPMAKAHHGRGNFLFADGHLRTLTVRQTLQPRVLWDNLKRWCPSCNCADAYSWDGEVVATDLKQMDKDRNGYP